MSNLAGGSWAQAMPVAVTVPGESVRSTATSVPRENPAADVGSLPEQSRPYQEFIAAAPRRGEPHLAPLRDRMEAIIKIVDMEGPLHSEEVARRLAACWGKERTGTRIQEAANEAIKAAAKQGLIVAEDDFVARTALDVCAPRDRANVSSPTLRNPRMIPPVEIRTGLIMTIERHVGVTPEEAAFEVTRMFGFQRTGSELRDVIQRQMDRLVTHGSLVMKDGRLYAGYLSSPQ